MDMYINDDNDVWIADSDNMINIILLWLQLFFFRLHFSLQYIIKANDFWAMLGLSGTCWHHVTVTRQCRQNWVTSHMSATFLGGISPSHVSFG